MTLLREATLDDLSTLLEFEKRLIEYEREFTPNLKKSEFNYYNLKSYIKDPEISVVVAEEKNKIIASGYALIPEYRGKGINKKILDYLIAWGKNKGLNEFQLTVYAQNESAINAYKKSGFTFETITMRLNLE